MAKPINTPTDRKTKPKTTNPTPVASAWLSSLRGSERRLGSERGEERASHIYPNYKTFSQGKKFSGCSFLLGLCDFCCADMHSWVPRVKCTYKGKLLHQCLSPEFYKEVEMQKREKAKSPLMCGLPEGENWFMHLNEWKCIYKSTILVSEWISEPRKTEYICEGRA